MKLKSSLKNIILLNSAQNYNPDIVYIDEQKIIDLNLNIVNINHQNEYKNEFTDLRQMIEYHLILNSINYMFWDKNENGFQRYSFNGKIGALAITDGINKIFNDYLNIENFHNTIDKDMIINYFGDIPDIEGRIKILQEICNKKLLSAAVTEVEKKLLYFKKVDTNLAIYLMKILPLSYEDDFAKKIQLSLYEIANCAENILDYKIDKNLTVAADYQIPKVLNALGILQYSKDLEYKINNQILIEENSTEEISLRAATILACDKICNYHNIGVDALDRELWLMRNNFKNNNFHLTKTRKY